MKRRGTISGKSFGLLILVFREVKGKKSTSTSNFCEGVVTPGFKKGYGGTGKLVPRMRKMEDLGGGSYLGREKRETRKGNTLARSL